MAEKKMVENKKSFVVKIDEKDVTIVVKRPDNKAKTDAQSIYNRSFRRNIESGAIVRAKIESVMREQNLWSDEQEKQYKELTDKLLKAELQLKRGGIKLNVAREIAISMRKDRFLLRQLSMSRNSLDLHTAEAQAENDRFNYLVSACTCYEDGKSYYTSVEDYLNREDDEVGAKAASALGKMLYGLSEDWESKLPENTLLLRFGFVDKDLHLVNGKGHRIDLLGRLVDSKDRLVNDFGQLVDDSGNLLSEDGEFLVEAKPFLTDDGDEVSEPEEAELQVSA